MDDDDRYGLFKPGMRIIIGIEEFLRPPDIEGRISDVHVFGRDGQGRHIQIGTMRALATTQGEALAWVDGNRKGYRRGREDGAARAIRKRMVSEAVTPAPKQKAGGYE
jgi:hypothetical protein